MKTQLTQLLTIDYPIIQAPMLGVTSPGMVAAVNQSGGFGSLPVGLQTAETTRTLIQKTNQLTHKPFAVNLMVHAKPAWNEERVEAMRQFLQPYYQQFGVESPQFSASPFPDYREQINVLMEENIKMVSFTFGIPDPGIMETLKQNGVLLMGTATCVREAVLLEEAGADIVVAQGIEAGGHRGTFEPEKALPQIGTMALIPQIVDQVKIPVVAAGGIMDGRGIIAALALGAAGVQMGSVFLRSDESIAPEVSKKAIGQSTDEHTGIIKAFTGRPARGIYNELATRLGSAQVALPDYPLQIALTNPIRVAAAQANRQEYMTIWAGQGASMAPAKPTGEIMRELIEQTTAWLGKLTELR